MPCERRGQGGRTSNGLELEMNNNTELIATTCCRILFGPDGWGFLDVLSEGQRKKSASYQVSGERGWKSDEGGNDVLSLEGVNLFQPSTGIEEALLLCCDIIKCE